MTATFEGKEIKQDPLIIMQLLARRAERAERGEYDGPEVAVSDMMGETDLGRGSVYNYLTNTLQPLGLAGIYDTKPTAGAAEDAKLWAITQTGYRWLNDLDPDNLAPAIASGEAVEKARDARNIASNAQSAANRSSERVDDLDDRISTHIDTATDDLDTLDDRISDVASDQEAIRSDLSDFHNGLSGDLDDVRSLATQPDQGLVSDVDDLLDRLDTTESRAEDLDSIVRGKFDEENDNGHYGLVRALDQDLSDAETQIETLERRLWAVSAVAVAAVILVIILILI
jgi:hypothetical protein